MAKGRKTGGRQVGTPNVATREIRAASRALLEDPAYVASLRERLTAGKAPHMETLLHYYAYGKPNETVEQTGPEPEIVIRVEKPW
jgi:hypothetical protein